MAASCKPRNNAVIKRVDENNLYLLFEKVIRNLKKQFNLKDTDVKESALDVRHELLSKKWRSSGINYDDISKCCGYLRRYAICHAGLTRHAVLYFLQKIPLDVKELLLKKPALNVISIGGGPGNDLLGFCCAVEETDRHFSLLNLTVIDFKGGWEIVFDQVMKVAQSLQFGKVGKLLEDENVEINKSFIQADLELGEIESLKDADLILMVKVLSNVSKESRRKKILKNVFAAMKENSIFLCVDTDALKVPSYDEDNMKILCAKKRHEFQISLDKNVSRNVIQKSTYEICALMKSNHET